MDNINGENFYSSAVDMNNPYPEVEVDHQLEDIKVKSLTTIAIENSLICVVCSNKIIPAETLPESQNNWDLLQLLCKTLNFPTIVPLLTQMSLPVPNPLFCPDCAMVVLDSAKILSHIKLLEEDLEKFQHQLKKCLTSSLKYNSLSIATSGNADIAAVPVIRKFFVQCWSDCSVQIVPVPYSSPETLPQDSKYAPTQPTPRSARPRGRPRSLKASSTEDKDDTVDIMWMNDEDDQNNDDPIWSDLDAFDANEFLAISEDDPHVDESSSEEEYSVKQRERRVKSKRGKKSKPVGEGKLKKKEKSDRPFVCPECGKGYRSQEYYDAHVMSHKGDLNFPCDYCGKKFALKQHLHVHNRQVHNITTSSKGTPGDACPYCGLKFLSAEDLRNQPGDFEKEGNSLETQDNNDGNEKKPHLVPGEMKAGDLSSNNGSESILNSKNEPDSSKGIVDVWTDKKKRVHMRECSENPRVKYKSETLECKIPCSQCEKVFTTIVAMQFHVANIHKKTFKFYCEICARGFQVLSHLQRHIDGVHKMEKKYECETCHMKFKRSHQLYYHNRKHTGELPFICEFCGKGFHVAEKLRRHSAIHNEVNRYPCHLCGKLFKSHHYRHNHISTTHFGSRKGRQHKKRSDSDNLTSTLPQPVTTEMPSNPIIPTFVLPGPQIYFGS